MYAARRALARRCCLKSLEVFRKRLFLTRHRVEGPGSFRFFLVLFGVWCSLLLLAIWCSLFGSSLSAFLG